MIKHVFQGSCMDHHDTAAPLLILEYLLQGCHSHKISKFPEFSLTILHFPLTNQT